MTELTGSLPVDVRSAKARHRRAAVAELGALSASQRQELASLRASESNVWVRHAMDQLLQVARQAPPRTVDERPVRSETATEIRNEAQGEVAELIVHELRHLLLTIELAADSEIDRFETSETYRAMESLRSMANSLSQLVDTGRGAKVVEASLAEVAAQALDGLAPTFWPPQLVGPDGITTTVDPGLLQLAILNCVRNAMDSSLAASHDASPVIVSWGRTDRDAWVAIIDDGVGITSDLERLFDPHNTTKGGAGHTGLGLTTARRAMIAMGGDVTLAPREPRGAVCELRWPQEAK